MNILSLSSQLGCDIPQGMDKSQTYRLLRKYFIKKGHRLDNNKFQSPSVEPTTNTQRSKYQNENEHSVYQRSDYTPIKIENSFNSLYKPLGDRKSQTLFFNSGMAAVSVVMFLLKNFRRLGKIYIGKNSYFETKWLVENYRDTVFFNEYDPAINEDGNIFWLEYPVNCTQPLQYPFNKTFDIKSVFSRIMYLCNQKKKEKFAIVIDYTLYYLPFDITKYIDKLPENLDVYLITSLQKHRGYGLDLTNGGAVTFYSDDKEYEYLKRLRAIMGTSITQETIWTIPPIKAAIINKLITDSGENAQTIYKLISKNKYGPVSFYFSSNSEFLTSFIFLELDASLMKKSVKKPYFSDLIITEIMRAARKNNAILVNGTSFGLPFSRIFKNSERYENTNSLRIAVGYDRDMNKNVHIALSQGVRSFLKKVL